jgi:hypothetical protein
VHAQAQAAQAGATDKTAESASGAAERTLDEDALTHALERLEAALRARTAAGLAR